MERRDVKLSLDIRLFEEAKEKMRKEYRKAKLTDTDCLLTVMLLALNQKNLRDDVPPKHTDEIKNISTKTYALYGELLDELKNRTNHNSSDTINAALKAFIRTEMGEFLSHIKPLYTFIGYKNTTMQEAVAEDVDNMSLPTENMELIDACCGTGALFLGLSDKQWDRVILNDLNPLRTNFLNALLQCPLKLIKEILKTDLFVIKEPEARKKLLGEIRLSLNAFEKKQRGHHKVMCDIAVAAKTFLRQCLDKQYIETGVRILKRLSRFLLAHWKLLKNHTLITQEDCLKYLKNTASGQNKLVILDVPYIGTENTCGVTGYNYKNFHRKIAKRLLNVKYPFLYFCRSSAPKSTPPEKEAQEAQVMQMKIGEHFYWEGLYFQEIHLTDSVTEVIISNRNYNPNPNI